jgi:hypothetical protein
MKTVLKTIAASAFAAALLGIATQAGAVLITVAEEGGWTGSDNGNDSFTGAPADNLPGVPGPASPPHFTTAGWFANSSPKSTLSLNFFSDTLDVPANGTPINYLIATLQQTNAVILPTEANPPLVGGFYKHTLDFAAVFAISSGGVDLFTDTPTGTVTHTETSNVLSINPGCVSQDASLNAAGSQCDDIYSFTLSLEDPVPFEIDGVTYTFDFNVVPRVGTVIGADGRIYTPEGFDNAIDIIVTIQAVPEPGTLGLLGLALVGLGFAVRRNRTA